MILLEPELAAMAYCGIVVVVSDPIRSAYLILLQTIFEQADHSSLAPMIVHSSIVKLLARIKNIA